METPVDVAENGNLEIDICDDEIDSISCPTNIIEEAENLKPSQTTVKKKRRPVCCELFICFSPEYQHSSCLWNIMCCIEIIVVTLSYLLCLSFVTICIGATYQISRTWSHLPVVQEALYNHTNKGPTGAFNDRCQDSNISTFLILLCGECGACSSWENLIIEYTTRVNMAALAKTNAPRLHSLEEAMMPWPNASWIWKLDAKNNVPFAGWTTYYVPRQIVHLYFFRVR